MRLLVDGNFDLPDWLVRGRTVLMCKQGCKGTPERHKPIACLNRASKLLTSSLAIILQNQKCAIAHMASRHIKKLYYNLPDSTKVVSLRHESASKYLRVEQVFKPTLSTVKSCIMETHIKRVRQI